MAKILSKYMIDIAAMADGISIETFPVSSEFFSHFPLLTSYKGKGLAKAELDKNGSDILLHLQLEVALQTICDRCLGAMIYHLKTTSNTLYTGELTKGKKNNISTEILSFKETSINISSKIYEDISLGLPIRFMHQGSCDPTMEDLLNKYSTSQASIDPRWNALKKLVLKHKDKSMAHPKSRTSKQRKHKRRTHYKAQTPTLANCSNCGATIEYHRVCSECGYYRGVLVVEKSID